MRKLTEAGRFWLLLGITIFLIFIFWVLYLLLLKAYF